MTATNESTPKGISPQLPAPTNQASKKLPTWVIIVVAVVALAILCLAVFLLMKAPPSVTTQIRDVIIIFAAIVFFVLGASLIVLLLQLAKLINMLQNEIEPIIREADETIHTLKGTTEFLSENLVSPIIEMKGTLAGLKKILDIAKIFRK